jgi:hypothetical protein
MSTQPPPGAEGKAYLAHQDKMAARPLPGGG